MENKQMENEELIAEIKALREELADLKPLREEFNELKRLVQEDIVGPIEKEYNDRKYKEATDMWRERYGDRLSPYADRLKATEGDDFDVVTASYDAWNETDSDPDEWIEGLIKNIDDTLAPLAAAFGVKPEELNATVEIENGQVADVQADTEPEESEVVSEADAADEANVDEANADEPAEEELSEEEQFQRELDEAYEKMKERRY